METMVSMAAKAVGSSIASAATLVRGPRAMMLTGSEAEESRSVFFINEMAEIVCL